MSLFAKRKTKGFLRTFMWCKEKILPNHWKFVNRTYINRKSHITLGCCRTWWFECSLGSHTFGSFKNNHMQSCFWRLKFKVPKIFDKDYFWHKNNLWQKLELYLWKESTGYELTIMIRGINCEPNLGFDYNFDSKYKLHS